MSHTQNPTRNTTGLCLLIPDKSDTERDSVASAFAQHGGTVHRLGRFWDPPPFVPATVRVYGPDSFCLVLQQKLGFSLCSPRDDLLLHVPPQFLKRKLFAATLREVLLQPFPVFLKPLIPKQFRAAVFASADELEKETRGLSSNTKVIQSELAHFKAELRCFIHEQRILDCAIYEGAAATEPAHTFLESLLENMSLPPTVVLDIGLQEQDWSVIEFNGTWGAGLNGCDPEKVLPAILAASGC
jgi:hypothetical protein